LNKEKLNNAVSTKRIFKLTPQNFPIKFENNYGFDICTENEKKIDLPYRSASTNKQGF